MAATITDIEACVFDAYGTLFDVNAATARCRSQLGDKADALSQLWRAKQIEYTWQRSLRDDYEDFWHITGDALDYAMAAFGVDDAVLRSRLMEIYFVLDPYPDAVDTLKRLKSAGLRLAILSNGTISMLVSAVRRAGLYDVINEIISVESVRIYKPHPTVYQLAVERVRAPAGRLCFVSANGWDASGAARFGLRVVWINRVGAPHERLPGTAEHEIRTLAELPPLLGF